mmetsp:Transcript_6658/g.5773  ORF Transcript_6658/g.5773 Transcript_6658/m.5773 type:complete len:92 (+) Transcript_6658:567-842(+)
MNKINLIRSNMYKNKINQSRSSSAYKIRYNSDSKFSQISKKPDFSKILGRKKENDSSESPLLVKEKSFQNMKNSLDIKIIDDSFDNFDFQV